MKCLLLPIKGTYYYHNIEIITESLIVDQPVFLVAEKQNKFDLNAIQIWAFVGNKSILLGYIPRQKTSLIHFLKNINCLFKTTLYQIYSNKKLELKISLYYSISIKQQFYFYWWFISRKLQQIYYGKNYYE